MRLGLLISYGGLSACVFVHIDHLIRNIESQEPYPVRLPPPKTLPAKSRCSSRVQSSPHGLATNECIHAYDAACGGDEDALHRPRAARHADHRRCAAHALLPHGGSTCRLRPTLPGELVREVLLVRVRVRVRARVRVRVRARVRARFRARVRVRVKVGVGLGLAPTRRSARPPKANPRPDYALTPTPHLNISS